MRKKTPLIIFLFLAVFSSSCSDPETATVEEKKKIAVETHQVVKQPVYKSLHLMGTVKADREVSLSFKIGGKIKELHFSKGDNIKKGTLLAELDIIELISQKEKVREQLEKTKRELDRLEQLFRSQSVSLSSLQDARSQNNSVNADMKIIEDNIRNSTILAPFTGRINQKFNEPGEVVVPGAPVAVLTELDPIQVTAAVPDSMITNIRTSGKAFVEVDICPGTVFEGVIRRLDISADPLSRTFGMDILISNPDEILLPGLIARVDVPFGKNEPRIFIPLDAVIGLGENPAVYIVKDLKAVYRGIEPGEIIEGRIEVPEGLEPGEMLVISGQEFLSDGRDVFIGK